MKRRPWPRQPVPLTAEQTRAREQFMLEWHQQLDSKYNRLEQFNHGSIARLPHPHGCVTLEVGAGIGGHLPYERLDDQDYHVLEYREEWCDELRKKLPADRVLCASIQERTPWPDGKFDRIVAVHVLEHLPNLPLALEEISRLMKPTAMLDLVLPCEGHLGYRLARFISSQWYFERRFHMKFAPIIANEHVSTLAEIRHELDQRFVTRSEQFFPAPFLRVDPLNLIVALRLHKR